MKWFLFFLLFSLSSLAAIPLNIDSICDQSLDFDLNNKTMTYYPPTFTENFVLYQDKLSDTSLIEDNLGRVIFKTDQPIYSMFEVFDGIWISGDVKVQKIDFNGMIVNEFIYNQTGSYKSRAIDIVKLNNLIILNQGSRGILAYDESTLSLVWENYFSEIGDAKSVAMTTDGTNIWAALSNTAPNTFTGIVQLDGKDGMTLKATPYDYSKGIIGLDVKAKFYRGKLFLNNEGWIHVLTIKQLLTEKKLKPRWIAHVIPKDGNVNQHYMMSIGDLKIDNESITTCGKFLIENNSKIEFKSKSFFINKI